MLRTIVIMANTSKISLAVIRHMSKYTRSQNTSALKQNSSNRENFIVRLCGQITGCRPNASSGAIFSTIKTTNAQDGSSTQHDIFSSPAVMKSLPADDNFAEGRHLCVIGTIGYKQFQSAEGRPAQEPLIFSRMVFGCSQNNDSSSSDVNEVKMYGVVKRKTRIQDCATCLEIATTYFEKKEQRLKENVHQVMIMDDDHIRNEANCVNAGANLFVHGFLQSERVKDGRGISRLTQSIRATKLVTVCDSAENIEFDIY